MRLGYEIKIEQSQKLTMTPELIQAIQILQFNNQELNEYVINELLENPLLEIECEGMKDPHVADFEFDSIREMAADSDAGQESYSPRNQGDNQGEFSFERTVTTFHTLVDYLKQQLSFMRIGEEKSRIVEFLIDNLDKDGYLRITLDQSSSLLNLPIEDCEDALGILQSMDPYGVGARNMEESLKIQLVQRNLWSEDIQKVLDNHLENLASNKIKAISSDLGISECQVQKISDIIRTLNPKPGNAFDSERHVQYVIPDVIVERDGDEYKVSLYEAVNPKLTLSSYYDSIKHLMKEDNELRAYMNDRTSRALRLIKSIEQRQETILNVAKEIVAYQREFFDRGCKFIKPLTLKQIADKLGLHESTISRTVNGKYMETCRGLLEMKYFFVGGVSASDGSGISNISVQNMIKEIIDQEDAEKPYSDQKILKLLQEQGVEISRRTVAKYREILGIGSSSMRKRY